GVQAAGHFVEVGKARGHAAQLALARVEILNGGDGLVDELLDGVGGRLDPGLADVKDVALDLVHQGVHFAFVIIDPPDDTGADLDHPAQEVFFLYDVQVITEVGGGGDSVGQGGEV